MVRRRKSTKASKRETLAANRKRGKIAEEYAEINAVSHGYTVTRTPHGQDQTWRHRSIGTGRVTKTVRVEVKSSDTAPLSKLQKATKKTHKNYKEVRIKPVMH